jgi:hypothetical protein
VARARTGETAHRVRAGSLAGTYRVRFSADHCGRTAIVGPTDGKAAGAPAFSMGRWCRGDAQGDLCRGGPDRGVVDVHADTWALAATTFSD